MDLEAQRKLVKEKLARKIKRDLEDSDYAQRTRTAVAGATGVVVLLFVLVLGVMEIDLSMPLVQKAAEDTAIDGGATVEELQQVNHARLLATNGSTKEIQNISASAAASQPVSTDSPQADTSTLEEAGETDAESKSVSTSTMQVSTMPLGDIPEGYSEHVQSYPSCNATKIDKSESEMDFMTQKIMGAQVFSDPFKWSLYACEFWPEGLYSRMVELFPPPHILVEDPDAQQVFKKCKDPTCNKHVKLDALRAATNETAEKWPALPKAVKLWSRLEKLVFHEDFEKALFKQLGITAKPKRRELRFASDRDGFADGRVRTIRSADNSQSDGRRIATMQFHLINSTIAEYEYGLCVHT